MRIKSLVPSEDSLPVDLALADADEIAAESIDNVL